MQIECPNCGERLRVATQDNELVFAVRALRHLEGVFAHTTDLHDLRDIRRDCERELRRREATDERD